MILELKVTLEDVGVPVWRKIQIDEGATFHDLHQVLQVAFDWLDYHLHSFFISRSNGARVENVEINPDENEDDFGIFDNTYDALAETEEILSDWFKIAKDQVMYTYDFGDNWVHEITLTKKIQPEKGVSYPKCTGAKNLTPEEDSRGEVLMGEVNLEYGNTKQIVKEINEDLREQLPDLYVEQADKASDYWKDVLLKAKEYHKLQPWSIMDDRNIFAVVDPVSEERLFCSVMGSAGQMYGLAVYIGKDGYETLIDTLKDQDDDIHFFNQRTLLLSFEDRENLEKEDYALVKTYGVPFRGRRSWPQFRSLMPGYYPWLMDDEEARLMLVALEQTMEVSKEIQSGANMPDLLFDGKILAKVPNKYGDKIMYENEILNLKNYPEEDPAPPLAISELDLKRINKPKKTIPVSVEFIMEHIDIPIQDEANKRPAIALLVLAIDYKGGLALYHNMLQGAPDVGIVQSELLKVLETVNGIPEKILMNRKMAHVMGSVIEKMKLNVETENYTSLGQMVIEQLEYDLLR